MKILMLNFGERNQGTWYRPRAWAGYLADRGHDVTIVSLAADSRFKKQMSTEDGIQIIETPNFMDGRRIMDRIAGNPGWGMFDIWHRLREIKNGGYDIIHCFEHFPNVYLPVRRAPGADRPIMVSDWCDLFGRDGFRDHYGYRFSRFYNFLGRPIRKMMDRMEVEIRLQAQAVTVISEFLRSRAVDAGVDPDRISLVRGSVDTRRIRPIEKSLARRSTGLPIAPPILGFLGAHQADVDFSLEAVGKVLDRRPDTLFVIVGRTDPVVDRKVHEMGLNRKVIRTGWCPEKRVIEYLSACDALLMPMRDNPVNAARWPNKIGEYMALARPVAATRIGEVATLIEKEEIGRVSMVDPDHYAAEIVSLLSDEQGAAAMGRRARKLAEDQFDVTVQGAVIEKLYQDLLEPVEVIQNPRIPESDNRYRHYPN